MSNVESVLLIVLGIGFAVLLVLGIILTVIVIKIFTNVRRVTQRVDDATENINSSIGYIARKFGPGAASFVGSMLWKRAKSSVKKKVGRE